MTDLLGARAGALALISGVLRDGRTLDSRFAAVTANLDPRDRAFARLLAATTLRRLGQIDAALAPFLSRPPPGPVEDLLRLGAAQLLFIDTPAHAAVDTAVSLAKRIRRDKFAGLVNAVLRKVGKAGPAAIAAEDAGRLNTPGWLWDHLTAAYGADTAAAIAAAHLAEPPPLDLTLKSPADSEPWATRLGAARLPTGSLRLKDAGRVDDLPGYGDGAWWVQDAAAALPARVLLQALDQPAGATVADVCAAPGGKTAQLAAAGCAVTAVDADAERLKRLAETLARTGLAANVVTADVLRWRPDGLFDAVLLDAPCTATGTIRRHPDLPHLKGGRDGGRMADMQARLLTRALDHVRPGGALVYAVCSLLPEEGAAVVDGVIAKGRAARMPIDPASLGGDPSWATAAGDLRTLPCHWSDRGGLDGFFISRLTRL